MTQELDDEDDNYNCWMGKSECDITLLVYLDEIFLKSFICRCNSC